MKQPDARDREDRRDADRWYSRAARRGRPLDRAEEAMLTRALDDHRAAVAGHVLASPHGLDHLDALRARLVAGELDVRTAFETDADVRLDVVRSEQLARLDRVARLRTRLAAHPSDARSRGRLQEELLALRLRREEIDRIVRRMERAGDALATVHAASEAAIRARGRLVESHLRLVLSIARRHLHRGLELPDLVQEGTIGLMRAIDKFQPSRGVTFASYAAWWIRQAIGRAVVNQARLVRLPINVEEDLQLVRSRRRRFVATHGRPPTPRELAAATCLPVARVEELARLEHEMCTPPRSLDEPSPDPASGHAHGDTLADANGVGPEQATVVTQLRRHTRIALGTLTPRERRVLRMRYGLGRHAEQTLEEIGHDLGVTRQRILQIAAKALMKLRGSCHAKRLRSFYDA